MVSEFGLIASTPVPSLLLPYPSLPRPLVLAQSARSVNSSVPLLPSSRFQFTSAPVRSSSSHLLAVAHHDPFFVQLDRRLRIAIQPVSRRVAAEQRSKRNPKLAPNIPGKIKARVNSTVDLSQHNIDRTDHGHHVGKHAALAHGFKRLQGCETTDSACARGMAWPCRLKPRSSPSARVPLQCPDKPRLPELRSPSVTILK